MMNCSKLLSVSICSCVQNDTHKFMKEGFINLAMDTDIVPKTRTFQRTVYKFMTTSLPLVEDG